MITIPPDILSMDFETASEADLKRVGSYVYSMHPSTRVLCLSWAFNDEPVQTWRPGMSFPSRILAHVGRGGIVRGWNVGFEFHIWNNVLLPHLIPIAGRRYAPLKISQLRDTMAQAAYWGLPMKLDDAGPASGVQFTKDKDGHKLMLQMCKPRTVSPVTVWWHETDAPKYDRLCEYCERDVEVERAVAARLPEFPPEEQEVWELDREINETGVSVDTDLVARLEQLVADSKVRLTESLIQLSNGQVTSINKTKDFLAWIQFLGYPYADLKKNTIKERLKEASCKGLERKALLLRKESARASTAKLRVLREAIDGHGIMRGMLQYYGATRTGRWAGRLFQPQNLPRPTIKNIEAALKVIRAGGTDDDIEMLFGDSTPGVVASLLRSCIKARAGTNFCVADFAQIEARVVAWLGGQRDILDVFQSGEDVYVYTAEKIGSTSRDLGKVLVLACGFGMGWAKFQETAKTYRLDLTENQAREYVKAWRDANPHIVQFWWDCDAAARAIAGGAKAPIRVGEVVFRRVKNSMLIRLPSGRDLVYRGIRLEYDDEGKSSIVYQGTNQITKKWGPVRTYGTPPTWAALCDAVVLTSFLAG